MVAKWIRTILLTVIIHFCSQNLRAQILLGGEIGINNNYLNNNLSNRQFIQNEAKIGYSVSFTAQFALNKWLGTETGIGIASKNHATVRTGFFSGIETSTYNSYISVPVLLRFSIPTGSKINVFFNLGISNSFWAYSYINADLPNILAPKEYFPEQSYESFYQLVSKQTVKQKREFENTDRRYEIAAIIGGGMSFKASKSYEFFTRLNYSVTLSDQQKTYQLNQLEKKNLTYGISFGVLYKLKRE